jgi:hypothetical protein
MLAFIGGLQRSHWALGGVLKPLLGGAGRGIVYFRFFTFRRLYIILKIVIQASPIRTFDRFLDLLNQVLADRCFAVNF